MPRDGSNIFSPPAGTTATPGTPIESAKYNAFVSDLTALANEARPIVAGGTGATTAAAARTALGVQASSPALTSIAALATAADKGIYTTAANTYATFDLTAAGRALLDDADAAAQRTTLELGALATAADVSLAQLNAGVYATQAEAEAGTDNTKLMTPLRTEQYCQANLPFNLAYQSAEQTLVSDGDITLTHGLGVVPKLIQPIIVCKADNVGFVVGDEVYLAGNSSSNNGVTWAGNATQIKVAVGTAIPLNTLGGTSANITYANWKLVMRAYA